MTTTTVFELDLGDAGTDVWGELHTEIMVRDTRGDLEFPGARDALVEYIRDVHVYGSGTFDSDDLDRAIEEANDAWIGPDLEDYADMIIGADDSFSPLVERYRGVICEALAHDLKVGGDVAEYEGEWFRMD